MQALDRQDDSRYQALARIGRGGMAEVVLAAMQANGVTKLAVLKCLWPELAEDRDFLEMFLDEARLCARLSHPNVVQTYEVLRHGGRLAMAMEYLEGQPLTSVLSRLAGELGVATRLRLIASVLAGLEYAHELRDFDGAALGVVHRDVSPHNVFVTYDGHVKLVDFGVAKTLASRHQTRPGGVKGKMAYMAPEMLRGGAVDRRADVFSVGVMLWELLSGRRFWGSSADSSIAWRLSTGAPVPELPADPDLPRELRAVCKKALALDPDDRQQSAAELGADLERFGALASESHARHLGYIVSRAFDAERKQRQALIEFHLRGAPAPGAALPDYESLEISSPDATMTGVTILHERLHEGLVEEIEEKVDDEDNEIDESDAIAEPVTAAAPAPRAVAAPPPPPRASRPAHGWRRTALVAGAAALVALVSGAHLGREGASWTAARAWLAGVPSSALTERAPASPRADATPQADGRAGESAPRVVELGARPRGASASTTRGETLERRERHAPRGHRRAIELLSDDVLDIDGSPLPPSPGSGVSRDSRD